MEEHSEDKYWKTTYNQFIYSTQYLLIYTSPNFYFLIVFKEVAFPSPIVTKNPYIFFFFTFLGYIESYLKLFYVRYHTSKIMLKIWLFQPTKFVYTVIPERCLRLCFFVAKWPVKFLLSSKRNRKLITQLSSNADKSSEANQKINLTNYWEESTI